MSRTLAGASRKMLTQTLRGLERDGLVARTTTGSAPSQVEYRLTRLGEGLLQTMLTVVGWAEANIEEVYAARARWELLKPGVPLQV